MSFHAFIQLANQFGEQRQPFFFLIDFEQQQPIICPLAQAAELGLFFAIRGLQNVNWQTEMPHKPFELHKFPMSKAAYQHGFDLVQAELQKGNSYLLNLTYPTEINMNWRLEQVFQQTTAPYKLYYQDRFVCFSPECFVNIHHNQIYTYPMKGTIDATLPEAKKRLLDSDKERQEHYTIVDLMRNDLATVAENVEVTRFRYVEKIQTQKGAILQTSSEIRGDLADNWQARIGTMLATLLPAGSISGAPKEKTVQIIQAAEQQPRGYYTGIFGLFDGESLQSAVAIRFIEQVGEKFIFRSGGGITILSELEDEYQELIQKVYVPVG
ncbi:aminodeoxychorismate synthase component I [Pasteurella multocida]|uniref:aminodeoxychorismate synthase component I n=1 Tax=Pasteurella multocida TaxID=747 RepID=UPI00202359D8|nr:aminodeoxychorismate synthase component I [Pasteurella multocida]MEB3450063.1 aminodeoxychorismate synthase component I [Pasteurella multocida]MEB3453073.1 aminodeoxychorismate synthase component I [Pasteurella multocida]MEB3454242.1 aminodeoxychorismate synthase component I [Pasteurella multocida]MEB3458872.1 aminodeoxychorismate synthase component I [Pasteurella multocida]MEB3460646.1 aminodeoxychorismate synthase component I [Pasteurella multocida]